MEMVPRICSPPPGSFFLFGPRGTGKTTWLKWALPNALYIDLLLPDVQRELSARPERLADLVRGAGPGADIVIDEVQRAPQLLDVVHHLLEGPEPRPRFVLTGSSARKLRRGGVNLLAGRALMFSMHPFLAAELPSFSLERALRHGLLPLVVAAADPEQVLRAYASLYLDEEVRWEGWARKVEDFARFLEAISFSHGAVLNVSNVARECQVKQRTAATYVEVLEDLQIAFRLPVFARRAGRQTAGHPKFYFCDAGIFRSLRPRGPLDRPAEIDGAALEGLVAQHLRAWLAWRGRDDRLQTWRTRAGLEVDFVVHGASGFWAIEIKNTARVRPEDLRGLRAFRSDYPECAAVLLHRGAERARRDGILCLPVEEFLRAVRPDSPLPG